MSSTITQYAAAIMKLIKSDVAAGTVPAEVRSWAELDGCVDANMYFIHAGHEWIPTDEGFAEVNAITDEVERRIAAGELIMQEGASASGPVDSPTTDLPSATPAVDGSGANALPDPLITFGNSFNSLVYAVTGFRNGIVAVVPIGASIGSDDDLSEFDLFLDRVDADGVYGRRLDEHAEPGEVLVSHAWPDIARIHVY
jgi:hypothetical protein